MEALIRAAAAARHSDISKSYAGRSKANKPAAAAGSTAFFASTEGDSEIREGLRLRRRELPGERERRSSQRERAVAERSLSRSRSLDMDPLSSSHLLRFLRSGEFWLMVIEKGCQFVCG